MPVLYLNAEDICKHFRQVAKLDDKLSVCILVMLAKFVYTAIGDSDPMQLMSVSRKEKSHQPLSDHLLVMTPNSQSKSKAYCIDPWI